MKLLTMRVVRNAHLAISMAAAFTLAGCANMSGLGGSSEYGCKAPEGVKCDSVSGNYTNALQNNLPSQRQGRQNHSSEDSVRPAPTAARMTPTVTSSAPAADFTPQALRAQPRVLRLWVKPWEDLDHDLNDQSYVYVQTDNGHWLLDHAQRRIRDAYAPIRPPAPRPASTTQSDTQSPVLRPSTAGDSAGTPLARAIDSLRDRAQAEDDK